MGQFHPIEPCRGRRKPRLPLRNSQHLTAKVAAMLRRFSLAALVLPVAGAAAADPPPAPPKQYVLISFDGAHDVAQWARSRALGRRTGAHFTYFLSCVFLLSPETRTAYRAPGKAAGRSNVGFALSKAEVAARLAEIWTAHNEGHEMASHGCGHFDGGHWSRADWLAEFAAFDRILADAYRINALPGEPPGWRDFAGTDIKGFRAPYLSTNPALYAALQEHGFRFDASGVSQGPAAPLTGGPLARFALPQIAEGPRAKPVVAMDYNLYVRHSGGAERPDEGAEFEARAYDAFQASFAAEYAGGRRPLQIGFHFVLMNGGAYWRALERFAEAVCNRPEVACVSYSEYLAAAAKPHPAGAGAGG